MSWQKDQGTAFETWCVDKLRQWGFADARRLAEGGSGDPGDIEFSVLGFSFVLEARARERMNVTRALAEAKRKATENHGAEYAGLAWKRITKRKTEGGPRQPDGERRIVVLDFETFLVLAQWAELGSVAYRDGYRDPAKSLSEQSRRPGRP